MRSFVDVEENVGIGGVPVDLLDVGGADVEDAQELVGLAVVELVLPPSTLNRIMRVSSAFQADTVEYSGRIAGLPPVAATEVMRRILVPSSGR